jgi:RNAse (barnase) inhibitor barstar
VRRGAAGGVSTGGAVFRVRVVHCDLAGCTTSQDVYERVLAALDAPDWHGRNLDALWDSVTAGDINGLDPPYRIEVLGYRKLTEELRNLVEMIEKVFVDARSERRVEVAIVLT